MYVTDILRRRQEARSGEVGTYIYGTVRSSVGDYPSKTREREGKGRESRIRCDLFHGRCLTMTIHIVHSVLDTRGEDAM